MIQPRTGLYPVKSQTQFESDNSVFFTANYRQLFQQCNVIKSILAKATYGIQTLMTAYNATSQYDKKSSVTGYISHDEADITMKNKVESVLKQCFKIENTNHFYPFDLSFIPGINLMSGIKPGALSSHVNFLLTPQKR